MQAIKTFIAIFFAACTVTARDGWIRFEYFPAGTKDIVFYLPEDPTQCGGNGWPKRYEWVDGLELVSFGNKCDKNGELYEFPLVSNGVFDGTNGDKDMPDRLVFGRDQNAKDHAYYCGLVTQTGAPKKKKYAGCKLKK